MHSLFQLFRLAFSRQQADSDRTDVLLLIGPISYFVFGRKHSHGAV